MSTEPKFWNERVQTMSRDQIRHLQEEKLRQVAGQAWTAPFFRSRMEAAGMQAGDLRTLDDLQHIRPFIKDELREREQAVPPFGDYRGIDPIREHHRIRAIHTSSGTTGQPTKVLHIDEDLEAKVETGARILYRLGLRKGWCYVDTLPLTGAHVGYSAWTYGVKAIGASYVNLGPQLSPAEADRHFALLAEMVPALKQQGVLTCMGLHPFSFEMLSQAAMRAGTTLADLGVALAPYAGDASVTMKAYRVIREREVGTKLYSMGGTGDTLGSTYGECEAQDGCHVCEDFIIPEILDPVTYKPVEPGTLGVYTVTVLGQPGQPYLRYNVEDVAREVLGPCSCGDTSKRMVVLGRQGDIVTVRGKHVLPYDAESAIREVSEVKEFSLVREAQDQDRLRVRVEVEPAQQSATLVDHIQKLLAESISVPVAVELTAPGTLPRVAGFKVIRTIKA